MKNCSNKTCEQINPQPLDNFSPNKTKPDGRRYTCKCCSAKKKREKYAENPDKYRKESKIYLENNKDYCYQRTQNWRKNNKEKIKTYKQNFKLNNPDKVYEQNRKTKLKATYNITLEKYNELLNKQNGCCAICKRPETAVLKGKVRKLSVDHCHKTGKIRELLCTTCNFALGSLKEDLVSAINMIEYIKRHNKG